MADMAVLAFVLSILVCILGGTYGKCPDRCICDKDETFVNCSSSGFTTIPLEIPTSVLTLDLSHNNIGYIEHQLQGLSNLRSVDLNHNSVDSIAIHAFTGLDNLLEINLEHNMVSGHNLNSFNSSISIQTWKLSHNNITYVPNVISDMNRLTLFDLSWNQMTSESVRDLLHNLPLSAHTLYLDGNDLFNLSLEYITSGETELTNNSTHMTTNVTLDTSAPGPSLLKVLSMANCNLHAIHNGVFQTFNLLEMIDLSNNQLNQLDDIDFCILHNLTFLNLGNNTFEDIPNDFFMYCSSLEHLKVTNMPNMAHVNSRSFRGLTSLQILDLSFNPKLWFIHTEAFYNLPKLHTLDLRNCAILRLNENVFQNVTVSRLALHNNPWSCDCETRWIYDWIQDMPQGTLMHDVYCSSPIQYAGKSIDTLPVQDFNCSGAYISNYTEVAWYDIGQAAVLDCVAYGDPLSHITWITPRRYELTYHPAYVDLGDAEPHEDAYHDGHYWHDAEHNKRYEVIPSQHSSERIYVLQNGSLYIDVVTRRDGGNYTCIASNSHGNQTVKVTLRLNHQVLQSIKLWSMLCGLCCAVGFLMFGLMSGAIRFAAEKCSADDRRKRNGIRDILQNLHEYKASQFGKIKEYKTAKVEKVAAYKKAKIEKIRDYKQATVASILQHMHSMQEHYNCQVNRIKDNCSQQADKLRDNYQNHLSKLKDYKSEKVEKVRDHYRDQALKIRDYGSTHMEKLREQYKAQQQHMLKLLELLDIGNCMSVIEAECMRTDSMLFDPDIDFDLEAQPVHVPKDCFNTEDDDSSEYMTAGSQSERSSFAGSGIISHHRRSSSIDSNQSNKCESYVESEIDARKTSDKKTDPVPRSDSMANCESATFPLVVDDNNVVKSQQHNPPLDMGEPLTNGGNAYSQNAECDDEESVCSEISSSECVNYDPSMRETIV